MALAQLRFADGKVAVKFMDLVPDPGRIVRTPDHGEVRVLQGEPAIEQIDYGHGPRWAHIVIVQPVESQPPAAAPERWMGAVRG